MSAAPRPIRRRRPNAAVMAIEDGCKTSVIIGGNIGTTRMDQSAQALRVI
jgi:hypothetical protein